MGASAQEAAPRAGVPQPDEHPLMLSGDAFALKPRFGPWADRRCKPPEVDSMEMLRKIRKDPANGHRTRCVLEPRKGFLLAGVDRLAILDPGCEFTPDSRHFAFLH